MCPAPIEQRGVLAPPALPSGPTTVAFVCGRPACSTIAPLAPDLSASACSGGRRLSQSRGESTSSMARLATATSHHRRLWGVGRLQLLCIKPHHQHRTELRVYDLSPGHLLCGAVMHEDWGEYDWLNGWVDANDWYLGRRLPHGLSISSWCHEPRQPARWGAMIADLGLAIRCRSATGRAGARAWLDGWQGRWRRSSGRRLPGLGYDQWLTINRGGSTAHPHHRRQGARARHLYQENYGDSTGVQRLARRGRCDPGRRLPAPVATTSSCAAIAAAGPGGPANASFHGKKCARRRAVHRHLAGWLGV